MNTEIIAMSIGSVGHGSDMTNGEGRGHIESTQRSQNESREVNDSL